jgi:hypothetical protein
MCRTKRDLRILRTVTYRLLCPRVLLDMATDERQGSDAASRSDTVVGSLADSGYQMGNDADDEREADETSEATGLLRAGTSNGGGRAQEAPRKDSWVGFEDFEGQPWWNRPSVSRGCDIQSAPPRIATRETGRRLTVGAGLVASRALRALHAGIWRVNSSQTEFV